jgi:hypothetical protein
MNREEQVFYVTGLIVDARSRLDMPNFLDMTFDEGVIEEAKQKVDAYTSKLLEIWEANNL